MRTISVDDRQLIVDMMLRILNQVDEGGEHLGTTDAKEALAMTAEKPVDVAFLDIEMPLMGGLDLARAMQDRDPRVNIVFVTSYEQYAAEAFGIHASGYLLKPMTKRALQARLRICDTARKSGIPSRLKCGASERSRCWSTGGPCSSGARNRKSYSPTSWTAGVRFAPTTW